MKPPRIGRLRLAIFIIAVGGQDRAAAVGDGDDAATFVRLEESAVGRACSFILHQRLIDSGTVHETALEAVRAIIFRNHRQPVVGEPRRRSSGYLVEPHMRVVAQGYPTRGGRQQILRRVTVSLAGGRIGGEVSLAVIGYGASADGRELVEAIGDVSGAARPMTGPGI